MTEFRQFVCLVFLLCMSMLPVYGNIDSLIVAANVEEDEQAKCDIYYDIYTHFYQNDEYDRAEDFIVKAIILARTIGYKKGLIPAYCYNAFIYEIDSRYDKSIEVLNEALKLANEIKDSTEIAFVSNSLGFSHYVSGNYTLSAQYLNTALNHYVLLPDSGGISMTNNNLGMLYEAIGEFDKALDHYGKSLEIDQALQDSVGIAVVLNNIGAVYDHMEDDDKAIEYYLKSMEIYEKVGDKAGVAIVLNNLGIIYENLGQKNKAIQYYKESLAIEKDIGNINGYIIGNSNIASFYIRENKADSAWLYLQGSYPAVLETSVLDNILLLENNMYEYYKLKGNHVKALQHIENVIEIRDSLDKKEQRKEVLTMEVQFQYERKAIEDSLRYEADIENLRIRSESDRKQKQILYSFLAVGLLLIGVIFNRFRISKKQNKIIEDQKSLVEVKNKEVMDSIAYAKNLQAAILPPKPAIDKQMSPYSNQENFVFYLPKDIVAGDFYWMQKGGDAGNSLFAVADCTGHGVPGAMVSLVCSNALTRVVKELKLSNPGEILNYVNSIVEDAFHADIGGNSEIKDGMDISLFNLKLVDENLYNQAQDGDEVGEIQFAGANNALWIVRANEYKTEYREDFLRIKKQDEGNYHLIELIPDKQPIGKYAFRKPFTTKRFKLRKGDAIYLFTDGYADQFGGNNVKLGGKKFKSSNFKNLMLSIQDLPMDDQVAKVHTVFNDWKSDYEQIDDVCVAGFRV